MSPWALSWDDENYYLIAYDSKEDNDIFNKNQGNVRGILIGHYPLLQHETMI